MNPKHFLKTSDTCFIIGNISDNAFHRHYAVQIIISLEKEIEVCDGEKNYQGHFLAIKPLVTHKINCHDQKVLILLINPGSKTGHMINRHILKKNVVEFSNEWTTNNRKLGSKWEKGEIDQLTFLRHYLPFTETYFSECRTSGHETDRRIVAALEVLEKHPDEILSLETISSQVALSPSRFIHLFKEETSISYRRMQLWIKLMHSFNILLNFTNLTELAIASGFSDSAHYSRTFKETFGTKPSFFIKI